MALVPRNIANGPSQNEPLLQLGVWSDSGTDIQGAVPTTKNGVEIDLTTLLNSIITALGTLPTYALPSTPTHSRPVANNNTAKELLAANSARKRGIIQNNTAAIIWIKEGVAPVINEGFPLYPNQYYLAVTTAAINGIQNSGGAVTLDALEAV